MIDIHCHILPGLDDGAGKIEESLEMARALKEQGVSAVACSPHVMDKPDDRVTGERIDQAVENLRQVLKDNDVDIEIHAAAEYYLDQPFPRMLQSFHPLTTINNSRYVLIEFPMLHLPPYLEFSSLNSDLEDPELKKLLPFLHIIVAHPERNAEIIRHPEKAERLKDLGALFQVNMGSITGLYGRQVRKTAEKLLKRRLVDVIATDAHSAKRVPEIFQGAEKKIKKIVGDWGYRLLVEGNPAAILKSEETELL